MLQGWRTTSRWLRGEARGLRQVPSRALFPVTAPLVECVTAGVHTGSHGVEGVYQCVAQYPILLLGNTHQSFSQSTGQSTTNHSLRIITPTLGAGGACLWRNCESTGITASNAFTARCVTLHQTKIKPNLSMILVEKPTLNPRFY